MFDTYSALGTQNERNRSPSERIEYHEQVNAHDRKCRVSVERLAFYNGVDCLVDANVEHGESLSGTTDDKRPLAAELLGGDHEADCGDDNLDDAVDTCCEETSRAARKAHGFEDLRGVVVDAGIC